MNIHGVVLSGLDESEADLTAPFDLSVWAGTAPQISPGIQFKSAGAPFQSSANSRPDNRELWKQVSSKLQDKIDEDRNKLLNKGQSKSIPAGVTYLLQMLAHDVVQSIRAQPGKRLPLENAVQRPLTLESLYGAGPERAPYLYAPDAGKVPLRFALGKMEGAAPPEGTDFSRGKSGLIAKDETLLADERNDSHFVITQLTVLWMRFHNLVVDQILAQDLYPHHEPFVSKQLSARQRRLQIFQMARHVVQRSWLNIVENDILAQVISAKRVPSRRETDEATVNVELSHAVMRCFHSLPLVSYVIREGVGSKPLMDGLKGAFRERRLNYDVWGIDWSFFFDTKSSRAVNRTLIFPGATPALVTEFRGNPNTNVAAIDYVREERMGVSKIDEMLSLYEDHVISELNAENYKRTVIEYLTGVDVSLGDAQDAAESLPVSLYLQLEAVIGNEGRTLGPVGSTLFEAPIRHFMQAADNAVRNASFAGADALYVKTMAELIGQLASKGSSSTPRT
jgi:hypothetical protein